MLADDSQNSLCLAGWTSDGGDQRWRRNGSRGPGLGLSCNYGATGAEL